MNLPSNPQLVSAERYMASVILQKGIKAAVIGNVLKLAWARLSSVTISDLTDRIVLPEFENEEDRKQIFELSPWSI